MLLQEAQRMDGGNMRSSVNLIDGTQIILLVAAACWLFGFMTVTASADALGFQEINFANINLHYLIAVGFTSSLLPLSAINSLVSLIVIVIIYAFPFGVYFLTAKKNKPLAKALSIWVLVIIHSLVVMGVSQNGIKEQMFTYKQYFSDTTDLMIKEKMREDGSALSIIRYFNSATKEEYAVSGFEIIDIGSFNYLYSKKGVIGIPNRNIIDKIMIDPYIDKPSVK